MNKKYIVRLTAKERRTLREIIRKLKGSSQKVRRAQMRLKADVAGPAWTDRQIAEAFDRRTRTVEKLGGKQEAQLIAIRLGAPPKGYANWSLRLLARKLAPWPICNPRLRPGPPTSTTHSGRRLANENQRCSL